MKKKHLPNFFFFTPHLIHTEEKYHDRELRKTHVPSKEPRYSRDDHNDHHHQQHEDYWEKLWKVFVFSAHTIHSKSERKS